MRSISEQVSQPSRPRRDNSNRKRFDRKQNRQQQEHEPQLGLDNDEPAHVCEPWKEGKTDANLDGGYPVPAHRGSSASMIPDNQEHDQAKIAVLCLRAPTLAMRESSEAPVAWSSRARS